MIKKIDIKKLKNKIKPGDIISKVKKVIDEIYSEEKTYNKKILERFVNGYKILVVSFRKFMEDDCLTKASSIAYTTIISLIPTLTVILTFYSIFSGVGDKKEELFARVTAFMVEHNIKLNIDPILESISILIENAGKIGGVGAVIMIFTATAVLRSFEQSLNSIWKIKTNRPIYLRIIFFWTALSLGPILIISGTTLARQFTSIFSSPNNYSSQISNDGKIWTVGNKATILYSTKVDAALKQIEQDKIDFDNQRVYQFDSASKSFQKTEFRVEGIEYKKTAFRDIQFINNRGWIVGKDGLLLITEDSGKSWQLRKYGTFGFNDIHMIDSDNGFIASDNGYLLATKDGGNKWKVKDWKSLSSDLNSISFYKNYGIIVGNRGNIIKTDDKGKNWEHKQIAEVKIKKRYLNLNSVHFINKDRLIIVCKGGIILFSANKGKTWEKRKFFDYNYYYAYFSDSKKGYVAGEKGILLSTNDGGQNWKKNKISTSNINSLFISKGLLWVFGDNGMAANKSITNGNDATWSGKRGKSIPLYLINFFTPFAFIWTMFLLAYMFFPNTKIPFKSAAIGAAFTGTVWVIFIFIFEMYIKSFSKGNVAIYGALAAFPIFLLMVYTSFLIVLFGAEVSFTLMHPGSYIKLKMGIKDTKDINLYNGIAILYSIYKKFEEGKGVTNFNELNKLTSNKKDEVEYYIDIFKNENLIIQNENKELLPANNSKNIYLKDIINLIHDVSLYVPGASTNKLKSYMADIFNRMRNSKKDIVGNTTLGVLIEKTG